MAMTCQDNRTDELKEELSIFTCEQQVSMWHLTSHRLWWLNTSHFSTWF